MSPDVLSERAGRVLVVTLNRPAVRNALTGEMARAIARLMDELDADEDLGAAILTGAGDQFSAGMDLKAFIHGDMPMVDGRGLAGISQRLPGKPIIAAVEGHAVAGGFEVALCCDLIVAGRGAVFGVPEVRRGLIAAGGGLLRLAERVPYNVAAEIALTGDLVSAEQLAAHGAVRLVERGQALSTAREIALRICENAPLAVRATTEILRAVRNWSDEEAWHQQERIAERIVASRDAHEGARAFAEKRAPAWHGQ
jgi:enoyl-CoA hydratase/carnithine racemase